MGQWRMGQWRMGGDIHQYCTDQQAAEGHWDHGRAAQNEHSNQAAREKHT